MLSYVLPLLAALVVGCAAGTLAGVLRRAAGRGSHWFDEPVRFARAVAGLVRGRGATMAGAAGAAGALLGASLVAGAALGSGPGSAALVYLALALGAAGVRLAAGGEHEHPFVAILAEPAVVVALGAGFLRWRSFDLEAVLGAQDVLGAGVLLEPATAAVGLMLAGATLVAACGARAGRSDEDDESPGGSEVLLALSRWATGGAAVLLGAAFVAGWRLDGPGAAGPAAWAAAVGAGTAVLALTQAALGGAATPRYRLVAAAVLAAMAAGSMVLVVTS